MEILRDWDKLPGYMRTGAVQPYYDKLQKKKKSLCLKRLFDLVGAAGMLIMLFPAFLVISVLIVADSRGGIFFCQERVTQYGKRFRIIKFRTMAAGAGKPGPQVTVKNDQRVTKIGRALRKYRLDELPQLINIITGDMSFVGARPEVPCFVKKYTPEMFATLLLPAGVTSEASICYKDEECYLSGAGNTEEIYLRRILPGKMEYNLKSIRQFSLARELGVMARTALAVAGQWRGQ